MIVFRSIKGPGSKNVWESQPRQYGLPAIVGAFSVTGCSMIKSFIKAFFRCKMSSGVMAAS